MQRAAGYGIAPARPTGFMDNFFATMQATAYSETTLGRYLSMDKAYDAYGEEVAAETGQPFRERNPATYDLPFSVSDAQRSELDRLRHERWAAAVREAGGTPPSFEDVQARAHGIVEGRIARADEVAMGGTGVRAGAGAIVGGMAGVLVDPPVLATMFVGAAGSTGVLRTALVEGGLAAATEVAIQPSVQRWRAEVGLPSGAAEAFRNIGLAAAGGFVFAGALKGSARAWTRVRDAMLESAAQTASVRDAQRYVERMAAAMAESPHSDRASGEHVQRWSQAQRDLLEGRPQQNPREPQAPVRADQLETRLVRPDDAEPIDSAAFRAGQEMRARALEGIGSVNELRAAKEIATDLLRNTETLDDMLRQAAAKRLSRPRGVVSLIDALRKAGGIQESRGELASMGITARSRPGLVRKTGMTLDDATLWAWERGFFHEAPMETAERPEIQRLLDAVRDDFEGRRVFSTEDQAILDDFEAIERGIDEFSQALHELGMDVKELPPKEIRGRLQAIVEEPMPEPASPARQAAQANARDVADMEAWEDAMDADLEARVRDAYERQMDTEVWLGEGDNLEAVRAGDLLDELDAERKALDEWRACLGVNPGEAA